MCVSVRNLKKYKHFYVEILKKKNGCDVNHVMCGNKISQTYFPMGRRFDPVYIMMK
jgi:hypothetical protein